MLIFSSSFSLLIIYDYYQYQDTSIRCHRRLFLLLTRFGIFSNSLVVGPFLPSASQYYFLILTSEIILFLLFSTILCRLREDPKSAHVCAVVTCLFSKPMELAQYFCSGTPVLQSMGG
jgi:hypothetical protein